MILKLSKPIDKGACAEQVRRFCKIFGESVDVTPELCEAHAQDFDWVWAAAHLLNAKQRAEYDRVKTAAWAEYNRVETPARAEYNRVGTAAWAEYNRVKTAAWVEYNRVETPAWAEYNCARARAFGIAYNLED